VTSHPFYRPDVLDDASRFLRRWQAVVSAAILMGWDADAAVRLAAAVCGLSLDD
jgi:hypothetical protein